MWNRPVSCVVSSRIAINPLKLKLVWIIFNNSVRTAKKTQHFIITKINWLMLFKEIITIYSENHTKPLQWWSVVFSLLYGLFKYNLYSLRLQRVKVSVGRRATVRSWARCLCGLYSLSPSHIIQTCYNMRRDFVYSKNFEGGNFYFLDTEYFSLKLY
jgi:hypothetical protein